MINDINDLRLFVRIAAAGSISETARRLNSSPPAISRRLTAMEERLGARLIDRSTRRFSLTEEGRLLFERGLQLLAELDELEAQIGARASDPAGSIRVGAPLEIGLRRIAPLVATFSELYPNVIVELVLRDDLLDVVGDDLDIGLLIDLPRDGSVLVRKLLTSRRVVCASPGYLAAHGTPERPEDLLDHNCARLIRSRHVFDTWRFEKDGQPRDVRIRGRLLSDHSEVIHDWARRGECVALKALWDIKDDLAAGRLVEMLAEYWVDEICLYAAYPSKNHLPRRVRVFLDYIVQNLA